MLGRNHVVINIATAGAIAAAAHIVGLGPDLRGLDHPLISTGCFFIGGLLPDCDKEGSIINKFIHFPHFLVKHRGVLHSAYALIPLLLLGVFYQPMLFMAMGYFLHLFWDGLSVSGIDWFCTGKRGIGRGMYKVGGLREHLFVIGMWCLFLAVEMKSDYWLVL